MTAQPSLWRTSDPVSSSAAAIEHASSGHRASQKETILRVLIAHPGSTASELAAFCGLSNVQICRRLPDLEAEGLVSPGPVRKGLTRLEQTWLAT
jgi:predicted ArsR family transcriptional regulator